MVILATFGFFWAFSVGICFRRLEFAVFGTVTKKTTQTQEKQTHKKTNKTNNSNKQLQRPETSPTCNRTPPGNYLTCNRTPPGTQRQAS